MSLAIPNKIPNRTVCSAKPFRRPAVALALASCLFGSRPFSASAAVPTAAIQYLAPPECPGAASFMALLEDRRAGAWKVSTGDGEPDLVVEIRDGAAGKIGRVRRPRRAVEGVREIAAADCGELVQALALSTVLSLDERTNAAPAATAAATAVTPPVSAPAVWIAGGGLQSLSLISSQPMPQVSVFLESGRRAWPIGPALGRPDVRLALTHGRNDVLSGERAHFTLSSAELTICPVSIGFTTTAGLRLCAAGDLGWVSGEGVSVTTPQTNRFLWAAAGTVARLRWAPGRRVVVEAQMGVVAPFERTTFVFEMPRVEVARVPALVVSGGVMVGLAIP
jgi:hypothetical protein